MKKISLILTFIGFIFLALSIFRIEKMVSSFNIVSVYDTLAWGFLSIFATIGILKLISEYSDKETGE